MQRAYPRHDELYTLSTKYVALNAASSSDIPKGNIKLLINALHERTKAFY